MSDSEIEEGYSESSEEEEEEEEEEEDDLIALEEGVDAEELAEYQVRLSSSVFFRTSLRDLFIRCRSAARLCLACQF